MKETQKPRMEKPISRREKRVKEVKKQNREKRNPLYEN